MRGLWGMGIAISERNPFLEISCPEECEGEREGGVVRG